MENIESRFNELLNQVESLKLRVSELEKKKTKPKINKSKNAVSTTNRQISSGVFPIEI